VNPDFVIFMDGGCTANPGKIAVAAVVCTPEGELVTESAMMAGEGTNNVAEYRALRHAIQLANLVGARRPMFCSDSQLVVKQIQGWWALKVGGELARQHGYCSSALMDFDRWLLKHVPRTENKRADWLACQALGHDRTLKKAPAVSRVSCEHDGRPGWSQLASK
jgi:ribonuclease HI